ncbi:MAG TPA: response regulator [Methylomirabilota bacterium]|nr:response regulator [Methylomirabilota bacterium]
MARVLVIDDDSLVRATVRAVLESAQHAVTSAADGDLGLNQCIREPFDLVLCDIFMPNKDGIETIRQLRRSCPALPIIAMSGGPTVASLAGQMDLLTVAQDLGATKTIAKPFTRQRLLTLVDECLNRPTGQDPSPQH